MSHDFQRIVKFEKEAQNSPYVNIYNWDSN